MKIGDKVRKIRGYEFRGTIVALGRKTDNVEFAVVEIQPGPNASGLLYIHPLSVLEVEHEGRGTGTAAATE